MKHLISFILGIIIIASIWFLASMWNPLPEKIKYVEGFELGYSYSVCTRCHTPWNRCEGHDIYYDEHQSMFAICEDCWKQLTPKERLPYYECVWDYWCKDDKNCSVKQWETLKANVLAGK